MILRGGDGAAAAAAAVVQATKCAGPASSSCSSGQCLGGDSRAAAAAFSVQFRFGAAPLSCSSAPRAAPSALQFRHSVASCAPQKNQTRATGGSDGGSHRRHAEDRIFESANPEQMPASGDRISAPTNGQHRMQSASHAQMSAPERKRGDFEFNSSSPRGVWLGAGQKFGFAEDGLRGDEPTGTAAVAIRGPASSNLDREMDAAVRAVQLACMLSQRTQQRVLHREQKADQKQDRSLVTVADWGVQAVVTWALSQGFLGESPIPMIAEEDTTGLRGMEKINRLGQVVDAVNECLREAHVVGLSPPKRPLNAVDVLRAIGKGGAEGGRNGRYWVLDPVDGTLGFVRGDQYAIALALIEEGQVVLAICGCPNFPLRKQWLRYHHRYYRLASRIIPPSPGQWHKGMILSTFKGAGEVLMRPLAVDPDGVPRSEMEGQMPQPVSVSSIDDPAEATFCEPFEKSNSSHSFTAGLAESIGLRNRPLRVYSLAKYAAIARGDAEIFMKFAKAGYKEKIWDHAAGVLIVQEAGGVVTDAAGQPLNFSHGRFLEDLDRGIIACSGKTLHEQLLKAVEASWNSSTL